jgi:phosphohistidine phosphatase
MAAPRVMSAAAPPRNQGHPVPKRLILLRHAKSAWDNPSVADFDRPLSKRGRRAAPIMGAYLARKAMVPGLILASAARRAVETLDLVTAGWPSKPPVRKLKSLYLSMPREMLRRLQAIGRGPDCVMLVGHNPGLADLASWLCGEAKAEQRASLARKFPTAAVAVLEFDVEDWADVDAETGRLVDFATPKQVEHAQ